MSRTWQLQEAKNKLSELVERATRDGPQRITKRGKQAAVLLSTSDYERLKRGGSDLVEFLRRSPLGGIELDRAKDLPWDVKL